MSRAMTADVTVNGTLLPRLGHHALNQQDMKIRISALEYTFRFTAYASTDEYLKRRRGYIEAELPAVAGYQYEWPTPSEATRTFGQWTISQPLGRGTSGHVYRASNSALRLVAMKVLIKHRRTAQSVDREIHVLRALTSAAEEVKDVEVPRVVRLKEVLCQRQGGGHGIEAFEEVALVLEPFMPLTLTSLCSMKSRYLPCCGYERLR
jgi:serine/threonine protein kinase